MTVKERLIVYKNFNVLVKVLSIPLPYMVGVLHKI